MKKSALLLVVRKGMRREGGVQISQRAAVRAAGQAIVVIDVFAVYKRHWPITVGNTSRETLLRSIARVALWL